jgi:hypothetical protein
MDPQLSCLHGSVHEKFSTGTSYHLSITIKIVFAILFLLNRVGGFDEKGKGTPEDLIFFYRHLDLKGRIYRVDEVLLVYRYHPDQATFSIDESVL